MEDKKLNIIEFTDVEDLYCIGDIHGKFNSIKGFIKQNDIRNSLIIVCGDCGIGFESTKHYEQTVFPDLIHILKKYNDKLIFIRGNHDSRTIFDSGIFNYDELKVVPDYTVVNIYYNEDKCAVKHSILCVGGATSIDRTYRLSVERQQVIKKMVFSLCSEEEAYRKIKRVYWDDEAPYYDEERLKMIDKTVCPIDIVCSHTAPSFCYPQTKEGLDYWLTHDKNLSEDLDNERKVFDNIYSYLKENGFELSKWCYGHFHKHNTEYIDGVKFCLLDMDRGVKLDTECIN